MWEASLVIGSSSCFFPPAQLPRLFVTPGLTVMMLLFTSYYCDAFWHVRAVFQKWMQGCVTKRRISEVDAQVGADAADAVFHEGDHCFSFTLS